MSLPPALSLEAPTGPAAMMRFVTILLILMVGVLGILAAHHAETMQTDPGHAVLAELDTAHQPAAAGSASPEIAGEHIAIGLATGCIVLIAGCALGLALLAGPTWRAALSRRLSAVAQPLRAVIGASTTALNSAARPSLVALSISRT